MAADTPRQLGPSDKLPYASPFSYTRAIIKEDVTYPIVPNCPIINVGNLETFNVSNIPVGTLFIVHFQQSSSSWEEYLCLRVPDDTFKANFGHLANGFVIIGIRTNSTSSGGGGIVK